MTKLNQLVFLLSFFIFSSTVSANQRIQFGICSQKNQYSFEYEIISLDLNNTNRAYGLAGNFASDFSSTKLYVLNRRYIIHDFFNGLYFNTLMGLSNTAKDDCNLLIGINVGFKNFLGNNFIYVIQYDLLYPFGNNLENKGLLMAGFAW